MLFVFLTTACSREQPATTTTDGQPEPKKAPIAARSLAKSIGSYDEAMTWLRSTSGFHFVLDDRGIRAEGEMRRPVMGAEKIELRADGEEWSAAAGPRGVTWQRRSGGKWTPSSPPDWGSRIYQRVTLAFDPQKKEGAADLVSNEGETSLYRFTNANTGEVHELWVNNADHHVERMKIGNAMELVISSPQ